jgi:hypothetical protein
MSNFSYSRSQQLGEQQEQNILGHGTPPDRVSSHGGVASTLQATTSAIKAE